MRYGHESLPPHTVPASTSPLKNMEILTKILKFLGNVALILFCGIPALIIGCISFLIDWSPPGIQAARAALSRLARRLALRLRSIPSIFKLVEKSDLCYHCRTIRLSNLKPVLQHHSSHDAILDCGKTCPLCRLFCRVMMEGPDTTMIGIMKLQIDQEIGLGDMVTLAIGTMAGQLHISCKAGEMHKLTPFWRTKI